MGLVEKIAQTCRGHLGKFRLGPQFLQAAVQRLTKQRFGFAQLLFCHQHPPQR